MVFKIQSKAGKIYEGEGYCVDPLTKSIVLKTAEGELIILNPCNISSISGTPIAFTTPEIGDAILRLETILSSIVRFYYLFDLCCEKYVM